MSHCAYCHPIPVGSTATTMGLVASAYMDGIRRGIPPCGTAHSTKIGDEPALSGLSFDYLEGD